MITQLPCRILTGNGLTAEEDKYEEKYQVRIWNETWEPTCVSGARDVKIL